MALGHLRAVTTIETWNQEDDSLPSLFRKSAPQCDPCSVGAGLAAASFLFSLGRQLLESVTKGEESRYRNCFHFEGYFPI